MTYAAFNINSATGKFVAFVAIARGMTAHDARADAISMTHSVFGRSARVSEDCQKINKVPVTAWEEKVSAGWGWIGRAA